MGTKSRQAILWAAGLLAVSYSLYTVINPPPLRQSSLKPDNTPYEKNAKKSIVDKYSIMEIASDFSMNEIDATKKYKSIVETSGFITDININPDNKGYLTIASEMKSPSPTFKANFDVLYPFQSQGLRIGDNITVVCWVTGFSEHVIGSSCHLKSNFEKH